LRKNEKEVKKAEPQAAPEAEPAKGMHSFPSPMQLLSKIYLRLPLVPFLDRQSSAILYCCIAAFFLFFLYFALQPSLLDLYFEVEEGKLHKNTGLRLAAGELYAYELGFGSQTKIVQYGVKRAFGCSGLVIYDSEGSSSCVLKDGVEEGDPFSSNLSLGNSSLVIFAPWMLAASENFSWNVSSTLKGKYLYSHSTISFVSLGITKVLGRQAFAIKVEPEGKEGMPAYYYIDSEKRILLYAKEGNFSAKLVSAPFGLNASQLP
jgi:hypothetical protein